MKVSLAAGLASGVGSLGLYYMLTAKKGDAQSAPSAKAAMDEGAVVDRDAEMQDEADVAELKAQLKKELKSYSNTPTFNVDATGKTDHTFTKEFMKQLTLICNKYQLIASTMIKNQARQRRHAALDSGNDAAYAKAFREKEARAIKLATEIEDIAFDYFGIIQLQWEASNRKLREDAVYQAEKAKMQEELTKEYATDLDHENANEKGEELTPEKAEALGKAVSEFTMRVMQGAAEMDPATGRKVLRLGSSADFELRLQKEKDLFY